MNLSSDFKHRGAEHQIKPDDWSTQYNNSLKMFLSKDEIKEVQKQSDLLKEIPLDKMNEHFGTSSEDDDDWST